MNSNSFYGFDTFNRDGMMYCNAVMGVDNQTSAGISIGTDKIYYNGKNLSEVLSSLSNSFDNLQKSVIQVDNSLCGMVDNIKVKPCIRRKDLKTLKYGV